MNPHVLLLSLGFVFFVLAAVPTRVEVRFEWLGAAMLTLSLLV